LVEIAVSTLDKDATAADSSTAETPKSEAVSTNAEAVIEDTADATVASPAASAGVSADREATTQPLSADDRSRAHEEEIERLKQMLREHNERLEAATQMLSTMRASGLEPSGTASSPSEASSAAEAAQSEPRPAPEQKPAEPIVPTTSPSVGPSGEGARAAVGIPTSEELSRVHNAEMEQLKARLREQDVRLDATTRLLSAIRLPEPVAPSPAPPPASPASHYAILGAAAALAIAAGFLYFHAQAAHPVGENQNLALVQTQPAASVPSTATQLAAQAPSAPAQVAAPAVVPPIAAGAQPAVAGAQAPVAGAQSGQRPSSLQLPVAQPPTTVAKAEPPPVPQAALPLPEQGPPSAEQPPDEAPPPEAAPVEKPALDEDLSHNLTDYLHHHRLPFVEAKVYAKAGTPSSVSLSGEVRSEVGKQDAETDARDFVGNQSIKVHNRVRIKAELASNPLPVPGAGAPVPESAPAAAGYSCTDLCQKDEGHCEVHCQNQNIGNASGAIGSGIVGSIASGVTGAFTSLLSQAGVAGSQARDCTETCHQTQEHCVAACSSGGSDQSGGPPGDGGSGDQGPSGPDQPPG